MLRVTDDDVTVWNQVKVSFFYFKSEYGLNNRINLYLDNFAFGVYFVITRTFGFMYLTPHSYYITDDRFYIYFMLSLLLKGLYLLKRKIFLTMNFTGQSIFFVFWVCRLLLFHVWSFIASWFFFSKYFSFLTLYLSFPWWQIYSLFPSIMYGDPVKGIGNRSFCPLNSHRSFIFELLTISERCTIK